MINKLSYKITAGLLLLSLILPVFNNQYIQPRNLNELKMKGIYGRDLFNSFNLDIIDAYPTADDEPIFWELDDGDIIDYNPVVLSVNDFYWEELSIYDDSEEFVFEMFVNGSTIFDSSYIYSNYAQDYLERAYDWNVSQYLLGSDLNLTVFFYQESDSNLNHTTSINVTIGELKETPTIDFTNFSIDLFHFPGSDYTGGYNYFYNPDGLNPYYHFAIYQDGYVQLKFGNLELYESKELIEDNVTSLMNELIDLGFFQLKDFYFAPSYRYWFHSWYSIDVQSNGVQEDRGAEESMEFHVNPLQFTKCLQAIKDRVDNLYFKPLRWNWQLFFIITGSSLGGLTVCASAIYVFTAFRRRR